MPLSDHTVVQVLGGELHTTDGWLTMIYLIHDGPSAGAITNYIDGTDNSIGSSACPSWLIPQIL
jgi:hypothetical protein